MDNLCIGSAQLGSNYGVANESGRPDFDEVLRIVKSALDQGIRFFDTAQAYGVSEVVLGRALRKISKGEKVKIISKLHPVFDYSEIKELNYSINQTLDNLQLSTIWGLMTHRSDSVKDWGKYKNDIISIGGVEKVKYLGASIYSPAEALSAVQIDEIDIIQVPFNVLDDRLLRTNFFELASEKKKKIFIRSVFLQGLLLMSDEQIIKKNMGWVLEHLSIYHNFLKKYNLNPKCFALKAIRQKFPDVVMITGIEHHSQLLENIELLDSPNIDQRILDEWWSNLPVIPEKLLNPSLWH